MGAGDVSGVAELTVTWATENPNGCDGLRIPRKFQIDRLEGVPQVLNINSRSTSLART
jgi:hypothetical protein